MKLSKAERRSKKLKKRKHGMRVDGRSIFVIKKEINKKAKKSDE